MTTAAADLSTMDLLTTTRTVRTGLDLTRDVDPAVVMGCLRIALQAPTGANREHWRWIMLTDPTVRSDVATVYREVFYRRNQAALDRTADANTTRLLRSARYLADHLHQVPVLVIACLELPTGLPQGNQAGVWGSLLPAAWNYALAARAHGLATAWTTAHLDREHDVADILGLPPTVRQGVLLPTAHARRTRYSPAARRPLDQILHVNGWHQEVNR
jgi:nitroreductase